MKDAAQWLTRSAVGLIFAFGLAACSDSSKGTAEAAAGSGGSSAGSGGSAAGSGGSLAGSGGSTAGSGGSLAGSGGSAAETQEARSDLPRDTAPDVVDADYRAFVSNTNDFGIDVFAELVESDTNVVFSPVSARPRIMEIEAMETPWKHSA